uniref:Uncharacterized protein n=1 Tax=Arion vulgaris TaxID=1028688 RepID=A0A0B6ZR82_9EUPU
MPTNPLPLALKGRHHQSKSSYVDPFQIIIKFHVVTLITVTVDFKMSVVELSFCIANT